MAKQQSNPEGKSGKQGTKQTFQGKGGRKGSSGRKSGHQRGSVPKDNGQDDVDNSNANARADIVTRFNSGANDDSWYTRVPGLADDFANLAFVHPVGSPFRLDNNHWSHDVISSSFAQVMPGIAVLEYIPTFGVSSDPTSPINLAAQQLFTVIRKEASGTIGFDKTDPIMVIMAMDSAYQLYEEMVRAYRLLASYDSQNRYLPKGVLEALGFSENLQTQMTDFGGMLDLFASKLGSINVPDVFSIVSRHSFMCSNVYKDSDSDKAQFYAYRPKGVYKWVEGQDAKPSYLAYVERDALYGIKAGELVSTVEQCYAAMNTLVNPILGSGDIGDISSFIARSIPNADFIKLKVVSAYDALYPVFDSDVLIQMMNSVVTPLAPASLDVSINYTNLTSGPYIVCEPKGYNNDAAKMITSVRKLFNLPPEAKRTPGYMLEYTRNIATQDFDSQRISSCGTEVIQRITTYSFSSVNGRTLADGGDIANRVLGQTININAENYKNNLFYEFQSMAMASAFNYYPTRYVFAVQSEDGAMVNPAFIGFLQDVDDYTFLDDETIAELNMAAIMSEFKAENFQLNVV